MIYTRKQKNHLCYYCNKTAKYQFKNGKYCCENNQSKCPAIRKINSQKNSGKNSSRYGKFGKEHPNYGKKIHSQEFKDRQSKRYKGRVPWNKGKTLSEEHCKNISKAFQDKNCSNYGKKIHSQEFKDKQSKRMIKRWKDNPLIYTIERNKRISDYLKALGNKHPMKDSKRRKDLSKRMLDGQAAYMNSFIANPSKPQVKLYKLIKSLYPTAILNYPSLNRSIDIAIPEEMIAIEYDCWYWHDEEKDKIRQKQLENIGWKFLRYQDHVPLVNKLESDLQQVKL